MKAQVAKTRGFHEMVKEFLINNGHTETLSSVFENSDIKPTISQYCDGEISISDDF